MAQSIGKPLMPWQQHVADVSLEIDPRTGRLAYREIVLTVPRRSGKSTLLLALLIHRMIAMDRPQVAAFTMQNALQARMRMRREWHNEILSRSPALAKVYSFTGQPGAEALLFENGSRIEVTASTASSGHGATLDLAVVDEAFDQPDDRLEQAFRPAIRTQPDAQLWWVSTAGGPSNKWFRSKVEAGRALSSDPSGTAIFEWSAHEDADASDPAVWWECMPALGYIRPDGSGLTEADIAEDYRAMAMTNEGGFRRAYLNQWVTEGHGDILDPTLWASLAAPPPEATPVLSVEMSPDRDRACIGAAWSSDGKPYVALVDSGSGMAWALERLAGLVADRGAQEVVVDGWADSEIERIEATGLRVTKIKNSAERAAACEQIHTLATTSALGHDGHPSVAAAWSAARWKDVGENARAFARRKGDIAALYAVTLALHGANAIVDVSGSVW